MNILFNGKPHVTQATTIAGLVAELCLNPRQVAVECNGTIVPRSTYADTPLAEGDVIEALAFVGGG